MTLKRFIPATVESAMTNLQMAYNVEPKLKRSVAYNPPSPANQRDYLPHQDFYARFPAL
jgi:hypothetical protein